MKTPEEIAKNNQTAAYWEAHPDIAEIADERPLELVAGELAYIAGDYADMTDAEVIETYRNEQDD